MVDIERNNAMKRDNVHWLPNGTAYYHLLWNVGYTGHYFEFNTITKRGRRSSWIRSLEGRLRYRNLLDSIDIDRKLGILLIRPRITELYPHILYSVPELITSIDEQIYKIELDHITKIEKVPPHKAITRRLPENIASPSERKARWYEKIWALVRKSK